MLTIVLAVASLSACGGGDADLAVASADPAASVVTAAAVKTGTSSGAAAVNSGSTKGQGSAKRTGFLLTPTVLTPTVPAPSGSGITDVTFESTGTSSQAGVPVTFGQVFVQGALPASQSLVGKLADGTMVPLQLDVKAKHADGSIRHAIISAVLPGVAAGQSQTMSLITQAPYAVTADVTPAGLLSSGFSAAANLTVNGQAYKASAEALLKSGKFTKWLSGAVVNEWHVSAPLQTVSGAAHPHLSARFAIRSYTGSKKTRVDVTIENNWAYEPAPQNFTYAAQIMVGGQPVYTNAALTHYRHARWRKVFWTEAAPQVRVKHNRAYLISTRAVPNYDQASVSSASLQSSTPTLTETAYQPMSTGSAMVKMGSGGGRGDIGLLPSWAASYLLNMDKRSQALTMATADLAGSWSVHYRDKKTDRPVSLIDFPYMTVLGGRADTYNPATKQQEAFPVCATTGSCKSPNLHDTSHQPSFAYVPYMLSGDYYYLEEMQFWAMYNAFSSNPHYRDTVKGLLKADQVRGQAWSLRTLSQAAYITPDADPLKKHFEFFLDSNLDWYNANYTDNASANKLGIIAHGHAIVYGAKTGLAPWQDDFFTSAVGHAAELGFSKAQSLLAYKVKFPIARMTADGVCWIDAAKYSMHVRDSATSSVYETMKQVYLANHTPEFAALQCGSQAMATALGLRVGEMTGYATLTTGYPANMQPALAYAATAGGAEGAKAWAVFSARPVKPDYSTSPQFSIVPR